MTGRINKPLPHPYDHLFKNGEDIIENTEKTETNEGSENDRIQNISAADDSTCGCEIQGSVPCCLRCISSLCTALSVLLILEIFGQNCRGDIC